MELLNKINDQLEAFKQKRADLVKELQVEFPALLTPILSQSKKIESISWTQYTPYFNDGDECVFGVNNENLEVNGHDESDDENQFLQAKRYGTLKTEADKQTNDQLAKDLDYSWYLKKQVGEEGLLPNPDFNKHESSLLSQVKSVLTSVPEDFYKDLFGDHTKVTVYKDGRIETEEYEHD